MRKPTFDVNVLRSALDPSRSGHEDAAWLFELAADGQLEIGVPLQGLLADFRGDRATPLAQSLHALLLRPGVVELQPLAVTSCFTYPGSNLFPELPVPRFAEVWTAILGAWNGPGRNPGGKDRWYVESHVARGRDVLVTDDVGMRTMCHRLRDEHAFDITAESLAEFAARFRE